MVEIVVPPLGESVTEATVAKWHKQPGDPVKLDDLLVELETDKVTLEVNASANGIMVEIKSPEGTDVAVGEVLADLTEGEAPAEESKPAPEEAEEPTAEPAAEAAPIAEKQPEEAASDKTYSPAAKKLAQENQVGDVAGTGKDGRVTKGDVISAMGTTPTAKAEPAPAETKKAPRQTGEREERVKMTKLRKVIAQRLKDSQNTAAILTTFNEADMSAIMKIRASSKDKFIEKFGIKLGFMSFFIKAAVKALQEIPEVNAEIDGGDIIYKHFYDIGVAVGSPSGLVVPVVRDCDQLSFADVEKQITAYGKAAKDGKITMDDMKGGTFTISNGGTYGSLLSTPIINPPQSAILGMHNIVERPMAVNGKVEIRPMMYLALSYDHRLVDGKGAVTFLVRIKELIENPEMLLFDL